MFRPIRTSLIAALVIAATSATAQLNGTYTIGTAGNFGTITAAITALTTSGVSGPVVFNVFSGTYTEQLSIGAIAGASATNTITFQSQVLDSTAVLLQFPSQATGVNDWTVRLNGGDYITFRHMTIQRSGSLDYGEVVNVVAGSLNIRIENCRLRPSSSTTSPQPRYAVRINSTTIGSCAVDRCAITNGSGLYATFVTAGSMDFTNNVVTNSILGVQLSNTTIPLVLNGNRITARNAGGTRGMLISTVSGAVQIRGNRIQGFNNTYYGILFNALSGTAGSPVRIENNSILASNGLAGISTTGGTSNYLDFFHNSICMSGGTNPDALGLVIGNGVSNRISNNVFYSANGPALRITPSSRVSASDNNVIRNGGAFGVYWGLTWYADQPSLTAGSGQNLNSLFTDPLFVNIASDLHLQSSSPCLGAGQVIATVMDDFDGEARPQPVATNPEIGADERPEQCAGMSGTYIIGASLAADHATFNSAVMAMVTCGISGPVVFEVENGTYTEQVVLPTITGNSAANTITFRGQSLDSSLVTLTWPTGSGSPTVRMSGADRVTFEHLTIQRTGTATLPGAVVDWESTIADATTRSQYITIRNCRLISSATSNALSALVLNIAQNDENGINVIDCILQGGHSGVRWYMDSEVSITVQGCVFSGQYNRAIACITPGTGDPELIIDGNIIQAPTFAGTTTVQVEHNSNILWITGNRITVPTSNGIGIDITNAGIDPYWTHIANNMVQCTGTGRGIRMVGANTGLGLYHNSVSTAFGYPLELPGTGTGNYMVGNAFRSNNTYVIYRTGAVTFAQADRNALFSPSANFVWWGAAVPDLSALRCLTGQQLNSIQADPLFMNNTTDLHLQTGSPCAGQSEFISGVDFDFDDELRALPLATLPDIGADEINGDCTLIAGTYVIGPSVAADFPTFNTAVIKLLSCGISGPVLFLVENGTYTEQIRLSAIKGSSSTNTVTFRGQALDSTSVILQYVSSASAANNHVMANTGADHVRFEHMTLRRTGTQTNARVVHLNPACDAIVDMRLSHCVITNTSTGLLTADLVGRVLDAMPASFAMENCALQGGGYAFYSQPSSPPDTVSIVGCTRTGGTSGISINLISGPITIRGNQLTATATDAVLVYQCTGAVDISRNRTTGGTALTSSGIFIFGCQPVAPARIVVANNEVISTAGQGIRINGPSSRVDVVYNSVRTNAAFATALLAITGGSSPDTHIRNNIFSSTSYTAAVVSLTGIAADRNVFWRTGTAGSTVQWNGVPYTTVTALAAGTGTNANSKFRDPLFYSSTTDLRSYSMEVDQAALPFAGIAVDKNGMPRHATTPDIGAFEFQPELWNETFNTCGATDPILSTGTGQDQWIYKDRKVVARFNDNGQTLGLVSMNVYVHNGVVRQSVIGQLYMDRNWHLTTQNAITTGAIVRLFHNGDEFAAYAAADPVVNVYADAGVAHYVGLMEDCNLPNNPAGNLWSPIFPAAPALEPRIQGNGGTHGYTAVLGNDGELYITTMGLPLPVELIAFTGERINERNVLLKWSTATEHNNAGFEVWRMIEGEEEFKEIGWVEGAGESQTLITYEMTDPNGTSAISYYKLKQVDHDGSHEWSEVLAVEAASVPSDVVLYPNPCINELFVAGGTLVGEQVLVLDATGRAVTDLTAQNDGRIDVSALPSGSYSVRMTSATGRRTAHFVKQ